MRRLPFDASPGDAGAMVRIDKAKPPIFFLVRDSGNDGEIGESSARLHQLLAVSGVLATKKEASAFGETVSRLTMENPPEVAVVVFRHSSKRPGDTGHAIDLTLSTVIDWINRTGSERLYSVVGK